MSLIPSRPRSLRLRDPSYPGAPSALGHPDSGARPQGSGQLATLAGTPGPSLARGSSGQPGRPGGPRPESHSHSPALCQKGGVYWTFMPPAASSTPSSAPSGAPSPLAPPSLRWGLPSHHSQGHAHASGGVPEAAPNKITKGKEWCSHSPLPCPPPFALCDCRLPPGQPVPSGHCKWALGPGPRGEEPGALLSRPVSSPGGLSPEGSAGLPHRM